jgi:integrase/recombinase XerD
MAKAKILAKEEVKRVLAVIGAGRNARRNRLAFLLSTEAAMRVGEISKLKVGDVRELDGTAVKVINLSKEQTKGHRARRVFVSDALHKEITRYLETEGKRLADDAAVIQSTKTGKAFSNVTLCVLFTKLYKDAGIRTSSHSGRRTKATRLNELGIGMRTIQEVLGHKSIGTTALYCDITDAQIEHAVNLV